MSSMGSPVNGASIFAQLLVYAQINKNIKAPRHWPLCVEFTDGRWITHTKGPVTRKMFPFDDVIMNRSLQLDIFVSYLLSAAFIDFISDAKTIMTNHMR